MNLNKLFIIAIIEINCMSLHNKFSLFECKLNSFIYEIERFPFKRTFLIQNYMNE